MRSCRGRASPRTHPPRGPQRTPAPPSASLLLSLSPSLCSPPAPLRGPPHSGAEPAASKASSPPPPQRPAFPPGPAPGAAPAPGPACCACSAATGGPRAARARRPPACLEALGAQRRRRAAPGWTMACESGDAGAGRGGAGRGRCCPAGGARPGAGHVPAGPSSDGRAGRMYGGSTAAASG